MHCTRGYAVQDQRKEHQEAGEGFVENHVQVAGAIFPHAEMAQC